MEHRVFVSSTYVDLVEYRDVVQKAIRQLGAVDVSMENFGARDERPKAECLRLIEQQSDLFVGIYAHRYGHMPEGDTKSITEAEYDAATRKSLSRFIYLVDEDIPWRPAFIDGGSSAERLQQFKKRLRATHICKPFANKDQLATFVAADLGRHILLTELPRVHPGTGPSESVLHSTDGWGAAEWNSHRDGIYNSRRKLCLVHTLAPSSVQGQRFDIFIYLQRHESKDLSDIKSAQFFLGRHWRNKIFNVANRGGHIGIVTSAYGEFLCVCRVVFNNGPDLFLDRYINFGEFGQS